MHFVKFKDKVIAICSESQIRLEGRDIILSLAMDVLAKDKTPHQMKLRFLDGYNASRALPMLECYRNFPDSRKILWHLRDEGNQIFNCCVLD